MPDKNASFPSLSKAKLILDVLKIWWTKNEDGVQLPSIELDITFQVKANMDSVQEIVPS